MPDQLLATVTQTISIPWRPVADSRCPGGGTAWRASDGNCYNGLAFNATFDFSSQNVTLPNDVIVGVAYNTADYGATPIHRPGPYNSLNVGIPTGQTASVGTDDSADKVFWDTTYPGYTAGFREDTNWSPNGTVALQVTAAPVDLKLDKQAIADKGCQPAGQHAMLLVDVHGKMINDYDSGYAGNAWVNDSIDRHLRIWQLGDGTYCSQVEDNGTFLTFDGTSPSGFSTVTAGIKGNLEGGYVTTFFSATSGGGLAQWGWIYTAGHNGTWLDQDNVPAASSGDITS